MTPDDWRARGDFWDWRGHRIFWRAHGGALPRAGAKPDVVELPAVGHYPQLEAPDQVLAAALAFFA